MSEIRVISENQFLISEYQHEFLMPENDFLISEINFWSENHFLISQNRYDFLYKKFVYFLISEIIFWFQEIGIEVLFGELQKNPTWQLFRFSHLIKYFIKHDRI